MKLLCFILFFFTIIGCAKTPSEPESQLKVQDKRVVKNVYSKPLGAPKKNYTKDDDIQKKSNNTEKGYGYYKGSVKTEWVSKGQMRLLDDFSYVDPSGVEWKAQKNTKVNGASIPLQFWGFIGSPFSGKYRNASVIHDAACLEKKRPWPMVHKAFYHAMRASDVSKWRAKTMYAAVHYFGPRWESLGGITRSISAEDPLSKERFDLLVKLIKEDKNDVFSLAKIRGFK